MAVWVAKSAVQEVRKRPSNRNRNRARHEQKAVSSQQQESTRGRSAREHNVRDDNVQRWVASGRKHSGSSGAEEDRNVTEAQIALPNVESEQAIKQLRGKSSANSQTQDCQSSSSSRLETQACNRTCPAGHLMQEFIADVAAICGVCYHECTQGKAMLGCRACDLDVCMQCHQSAEENVCGSLVGYFHDDNSTASTNTPRQDCDVQWTNVDDVWWPQDVLWSWDWQEIETENEFAFNADEELLGPDGELYEIFYPGDSPPEDFPTQESSGRSSEHSYMMSDTGQWDETDGDLLPGGPGSRAELSEAGPQTSAEACVLSILNFMRGIAAVSYPARAQLFETVHLATAASLGDHFERFALVGSTALRIDTPDSDLDAVVFTKSCTGPLGEEFYPPLAVDILNQIAQTLSSFDPSLQLQVVHCTRVPVLTVFSADGELSLDLSVDQPQSELHVLWLQSQRKEPVLDFPYMQGVPVPTLDGWEQGLEAAALRCIKWWLRRRHIPVSKEGGYPTVVWTLMVIHALRCSVFYNEAARDGARGVVNERTLLGAIAVFFDRFAEGGLSGTLLFAEGKHAEFRPQHAPQNYAQQPPLSSDTFSVLDPTTTDGNSAAFGIEPMELAPRISSATQLFHAYELRRAQQLSSLALQDEELNQDSSEAGIALNELFAENEAMNLLPAVVPEEPVGVMFLCEGVLVFGILWSINLKPGWSAPFLHRHDMQSRIAVNVCSIDVDAQLAALMDSEYHWLCPADVVCMASVRKYDEAMVYILDTGSLDRWCNMHALLGHVPLVKTHDDQSHGDHSHGGAGGQSKASRKGRYARNRRQNRSARI